MDKIIEKAKEYSREDTIVVLFANMAFRDKVLKRIASFDKLNIPNYLIIALDNELYNLLSETGFQVVLYPLVVNKNARTRRNLWIQRTIIMRKLVESGLHVLNIDGDADIVKDFFPLFENYLEYDLITTPGTVWPKSVHGKWGFVIRCGFILYRSTANTISFMNKLEQRVKKTGDDQIAINALLSDMGVGWQTNGIRAYPKKFRRTQYQCFGEPIVGDSSGKIKVVVLPHKYFPRLIDREGAAYVVDLIDR